MSAAVLKLTLQLESEAIPRQTVSKVPNSAVCWLKSRLYLIAKFVFNSYKLMYRCLSFKVHSPIRIWSHSPSKSVKRTHEPIEFQIQQCAAEF